MNVRVLDIQGMNNIALYIFIDAASFDINCDKVQNN